MGWKGIIRSAAASARRAERDEARRERARQRQVMYAHRELMKQHAAAMKTWEVAHAAQMVAEYHAYVARLCTVHMHCGTPWNWERVAAQSPPAQPQFMPYAEQQAQQQADSYRPGIGDKLFGLTKGKQAQLTQAAVHARQQDHARYQQELAQHQAAYQHWQWQNDLANGILSGEIDAFRAAVEVLSPLPQIPELADVATTVIDTKVVEVDVTLEPNEDLIPEHVPKQLASGKLSWKKQTKSAYNELFQDHVCSCTLRVAREVLALLPVEMVLVHNSMPLLNKKTGHTELQPILSVAVPRQTLAQLDLSRIDPSDSMENFVHEMKFAKTGGFGVVRRVTSGSLGPGMHEVASM